MPGSSPCVCEEHGSWFSSQSIESTQEAEGSDELPILPLADSDRLCAGKAVDWGPDGGHSPHASSIVSPSATQAGIYIYIYVIYIYI